MGNCFTCISDKEMIFKTVCMFEEANFKMKGVGKDHIIYEDVPNSNMYTMESPENINFVYIQHYYNDSKINLKKEWPLIVKNVEAINLIDGFIVSSITKNNNIIYKVNVGENIYIIEHYGQIYKVYMNNTTLSKIPDQWTFDTINGCIEAIQRKEAGGLFIPKSIKSMVS